MASWLSSATREPAPYLPLTQSGASSPTSTPRQRRSSLGGSPASSLRGDEAAEQHEKEHARRSSVGDGLSGGLSGPSSPSGSALAGWLPARRTRRVLLLAAVLAAGLYACVVFSATGERVRTALHAGWSGASSSPPPSPPSPPSASAQLNPLPAYDSSVPLVWQPSCAASTWSAGLWAPSPLPPNASVWAASPSLGRGGRCAQDFIRVDWYLGVVPPGGRPVPDTAVAKKEWGGWGMSEYRERAAGWKWVSGSDTCRREVEGPWETEREDADEGTVKLLQDLVDRGGWLVVGDSLSEEHFFSLSCQLYPHVRGEWPYRFMTTNQWQFKEEHLLLHETSPLIRSGRLRVPKDWDWEGRPLISHVRSDHGFSATELLDLYRAVHSPLAPSAFRSLYPALSSLTPHKNVTKLLRDYVPLSPSLDYILALFLSPSSPRNVSTSLAPAYAPSETPPSALAAAARVTRSAHYRALVFSTGAHFSARQFDFNGAGSPLEDAAPTEFFQLALRAWLARVGDALREGGRGEGKEVLVRPTNIGHDGCHDAKGPLKEVDRGASVMWNWKELWRMNEAAEDIVRDAAHPQLHFLDLNRPAALRPDAHTNVDCLHLAIGTGVVEGWTRYIAYWLRERAGWSDETAGARVPEGGERLRRRVRTRGGV